MLGTKLRTIEGGRLAFWCPGCESMHQIRVEGDRPGALWQWDKNIEAPTFSPSILTTYRDLSGEGKDEICHIFVNAGVLDFLGDCSHKLAGSKVPLPPIPAGWRDA